MILGKKICNVAVRGQLEFSKTFRAYCIGGVFNAGVGKMEF